MSTQSEASIPISILAEEDNQHFRLLELPTELVALLTSDNAPTLLLKSREVNDETANTRNVVLCSTDKTYNIRQVSTSNSVYITRPCSSPPGGSSDSRRLGVEAISKCNSTIELLPTTSASAAPFIRSILPTFLSSGAPSSQQQITKHQLFSNIPLSLAECNQGWNELACFETTDGHACFIPSARVRSQAWHAILETATAAKIDLTIAYPHIGLPHFLSDLEADWPRDLLTAILNSVSERDSDGDLALNEGRCLRFVGLAELESQSEGRIIEIQDLFSKWREGMPEKWRLKCQLSVLEGHYALHNNDSCIAFVAPTRNDDSSNVLGPSKASIGAKRKWHEKFRPTKKSS